MYCTHCGKQIPDGSKFCPVCGSNLQTKQKVDVSREKPKDKQPFSFKQLSFPMKVVIITSVVLIILTGAVVITGDMDYKIRFFISMATFILSFSIACLFIVGIVDPTKVHLFSFKKTRLNVIWYYGLTAMALFVFTVFMIPPHVESNAEAPVVAEEQTVDDTENKTESDNKVEPKKEEPFPIANVRLIVEENSIGVPTVALLMRNVSGKTIDAYKVQIYARNNYGEPVKGYGHYDYYSGISQVKLADGETTDADRCWTLSGFDNGRKFTCYIVSVHFTDGTEWKPNSDYKPFVEGEL